MSVGRLPFDATALFDHPESDFRSANLWPQDRSWLTWTDYDLAIEVVGPTTLIGALLTDPELEALRLPRDD
ncbi:hypothetical protein [Kitasatospora griseola]|uniref:hypothetical protein n=1 Tax=Kitasatospora griseola TaxID=2064 RepID=UPI00343A5364